MTTRAGKFAGTFIAGGLKSLITPVIAIILALILGAAAIALMGLSPLKAYQSLLQGALGSINGIGETLVKATPLIFTGLSFGLAKKGGLINIGAEGQLYLGGLCSVIVGIALKGWPIFIHLPLAIVAGFIGGGLLGLLSGWLKVRFGASEIITTVMLNYVAQYFVSYMVNGPLIEPPGNFPQSPPVAESAQLPIILAGTRLHLGFIIALLAIVAYYVFLWRTSTGYEVRVVGQNPHAAGYAGMNARRDTLLVMFLAGGLGGLAGVGEILGIQHRLFQNFSPGYGFDGIAVSLLGYNTPIGILLAAILFGILRAGGNMMQMMANVPVAIVYVIQAFVIIFVAAEALMRRWQVKRRAARTAAGAAGLTVEGVSKNG
ncbi:Branched-chain amino acid transport system / permease component [Neomoorella glycerini]|uniref:Branched-chain amino acid transport system / permease component n=1 Tax=Neomoorella glycerini TaxID=55779 RepID=A0A6I5ZN41_9FIRM|nr:ABC transporter permease [Moorella glycerini]QGP91228.1 Branched-chain amino acid transport system / permease component [Moorella glycerini]